MPPHLKLPEEKRKKLALAGIMSVNPDLWILDETLEELDNPSRIKLFSMLENTGKTVIIFSSKYFRVFEAADAFFLLKNGGISEKERFSVSKRLLSASWLKAGIIPDLPERRSCSSGIRAPLLSAGNLRYS